MTSRNWADVIIVRPPDNRRKHLSIDALDSVSRDLAQRTFITVSGLTLSCTAYRALDNGDLQLTIRKPGWQFLDADDQSEPPA